VTLATAGSLSARSVNGPEVLAERGRCGCPEAIWLWASGRRQLSQSGRSTVLFERASSDIAKRHEVNGRGCEIIQRSKEMDSPRALPSLNGLLAMVSIGREIRHKADAAVERVQKLHHGIDLVGEFGIRERCDLGLEGLQPRGADRQIDALALDLRRLRERPFDFAELRVAPLPVAGPWTVVARR
jgi:hypothetical protein